jgi:uncharacterized membrane protein HdeD (DUF308 family)
MTQETGDLAPDGAVQWVTLRERVQHHWGLVLAYGSLTFLLGLAMAVWPRETVTVVAVLLALELLLTGCMRVFVALADSTIHGAARVLIGLAGLLALVVGVLFFMAPLQTVGFLVVLAGCLLILVGFADLALALVSSSEHRVWDVVRGVLSVAAGGFLVVSPERSLHLLVVVTSAWLLCYGFVVVVTAFLLRPQARTGDPANRG